MIAIRSLALACAAFACASTPAASPEPSTAAPAAATVGATAVDGDRRCAAETLRSLVAAFNDGDDVRLSRLVGTSIWGSLTLPGSISTHPQEAVAALLTRSRAGERWTLTRLDFNGRGWDGALHFGLVIRRTGPDLPSPYVDSAGKGALDCPPGRLLILGLGTGIPPRAADANHLR